MRTVYHKKSFDHRGMSLIEALLSVSLFALLVTAVAGAWLYGEEATRLSGTRARALMFASQGEEATRAIRDGSFSLLTPGTYGLSGSGATWVWSGFFDTKGIYTREVVIGAPSFHTRIATTSITWQQNQQRSGVVEVASVFTNWLRTWADPLLASTLDLSGNNDGLRAEQQGNYVYLIRASGTPNFHVIDVSNPGLPVSMGSLALAGVPTDLVVSGSYAYVSSTDNSQELQVVNITNPAAPALQGAYNASGNTDALTLTYSSNRVYLLRTGASNFMVVNVTTPAAPVLQGVTTLSGSPLDAFHSGNYVYVASNTNTQELQVVNVTNPASPAFAGTLDLATTADASAITGFGTMVLIGRAELSRLDVVSVATPSSPSAVGTISFGGGVTNALTLGNGNTYVFMATSHTTGEFKVVDILTPATPALVGVEDLSGAVQGVTYDSVRDRVYGASTVNTAEFILLRSQP